MQETAEPPSGDGVIRSDPMRFCSSSTELVSSSMQFLCLLGTCDFPMMTSLSFMCRDSNRFLLTRAKLPFLGAASEGLLLKRAPRRLVSWADSENVKAFPNDGQIAEGFLRHFVGAGSRHSVLTGAVECFASCTTC